MPLGPYLQTSPMKSRRQAFRFTTVNRPLLLVIFCSLMISTQTASGLDPNCTLHMTNDYVADAYSMYEEAESQAACLQLCQDYARKNVEVMADSDVVTILEWTCNYQGDAFFRRLIKPAPDGGDQG